MKMITKELEKKMDRYPLYSQDGKGNDAVVLFKVFNPYGGQSWYVLEAGEVRPDGDRELYGLYTCGGEKEYGYWMLSDLTDTKIKVWGHYLPLERDRWFKGNVADAMKDAMVC